jgi:hypothetical protein
MAWWGSSERGIGRGEIAESRIEAPFIAVFAVICAVILFVFHFTVQETNYTIAVAISMLVFGLTLVRVENGVYILLVAMLLSPEIESGAVGASNERGVNLRYDDILIIVIFLGVLVKNAFEGRVTPWRANPINSGILAYYFVCILSSLRAWFFGAPAWDKYVAFFVMLKMAEFYIVFFVVGLAINSMAEVRHQLRVFIGVALVVSIYGIVSIRTIERVSAPFEVGGTEPNTLGGYLIIVMCIALGLMIYSPKRWQRLVLAATAIIAFIPFIMTLSRASYISLIAAIFVLGLMARKPFIIILMLLVLFASPFLMPLSVRERVAYTFRESDGQVVTVAGRDTGLQVDTSTYERIYVWQKVQFNLGVWPYLGGGVSWDTVLDSQYARLLIETGFFGLFAFLFMLYRILRTARQTQRWSSDWVGQGLGLALMAISAGLIVHGFGTISFLIVRIMEPFWFLMALTVVARDVAIRDHAQRVAAYQVGHASPPEGESGVGEPVVAREAPA